jgi:hypothetical protein
MLSAVVFPLARFEFNSMPAPAALPAPSLRNCRLLLFLFLFIGFLLFLNQYLLFFLNLVVSYDFYD